MRRLKQRSWGGLLVVRFGAVGGGGEVGRRQALTRRKRRPRARRCASVATRSNQKNDSRATKI